MTTKAEDSASGNIGNAFINVIDIQRESVIARIQIDTGDGNDDSLASINRARMTSEGTYSRIVPRKSLADHRITTMFYDESAQVLYIGFSDGQVEGFRGMSLN